MNEEYDSWEKSGHHHVAVCVDCHLPDAFIPKLIEKTRHGWNHSEAFTLQNFHEPTYRSPDAHAQTVQDNCIRCHADFVHDITAMESSNGADSVSCVHCHMNVGHAPTSPTSSMSWIGAKQ